MNILQALILGIIQGITEWLPISSSGHLVLAQEYFGLEVPLAFDVILHFGTLLVVLIVFWKDILAIAKSLFAFKKDENTKLLLYIIIATIPIAIVGYFFRDLIKSLFQSVLAVGIALMITGTVLFVTKFTQHKKEINWKNSLIVGIAQAVALVPGISRSGSTISAGLLSGIKREKIASFSFLIFIPAMIGATILEIRDITSVEIGPIISGTLAAIIVGYISLIWLLKIIKKGKFHHFSWYCWTLGIITIIISLV